MSRSTRKPVWTEGYGGSGRKTAKRKANRKVRKADPADGKAYRKEYNPYNIVDWKSKEFKSPSEAARLKPWKVKSK